MEDQTQGGTTEFNDHKETESHHRNHTSEHTYFPAIRDNCSLVNKSDRNFNSEEGHKKKRKKKKRDKDKMRSNESIDQEGVGKTMSYKQFHNGNVSIPLDGFQTPDKLRELQESLTHSADHAFSGKQDARKLAIQQALNSRNNKHEEFWHFDYVLVHRTGDNNTATEKLRQCFEAVLHEEGFKIERKYTTERTFVILHCSFERLCEEAEHVALQMPLAGYVVPGSDKTSFWDRFKTDNTVDFVSAPFCVAKRHIYEGIENIDTFFRPALRSLLVHHLLQNMDVRDKEDRALGQNPQGLAYMLMEKAYSDAFILHERSLSDTSFPLSDAGDDPNGFWLHGQDVSDPRTALHNTWLKWFKYQPLWKIRNYFGEKIALYFAWLGLLTFSLVVPSLLGIAIFLWGLGVVIIKRFFKDEVPSPVSLGAKDNPIRSEDESNTTLSQTVQLWAKNAFDNDATPFFALIICLWGTLFLELWKRQNSTVAYQWDVNDFEEQEPNRPQFYGTKIRTDPVTGEDESYYPFRRQFVKMTGSFSLMLFMGCLVLASLFAVIVYRVVAREDYFKDRGTAGSLVASVSSTFLNTLSIMIMQKVYQKLALKLTNWENHRTQTAYEDALIIKLFGFQFVNSYTSLFYIAFFREGTAGSGILGFGQQYNDACGATNDCMTLLSLQVAMLMIMKPLPKLFTDVVLPWLKKQWRLGLCRCCGCSNKVDHDLEGAADSRVVEDYVERERNKEPLGDFTLSEYNEKVLQYGFLMLFAAAFPLAPLIALLTNAIDMRVDARRMLWINRRPVAFRAEDIGMWYAILEFLNLVGVVTNAFLIAFTSQYGRKWEGQALVTNSTQTLIDRVTNVTTLVQTVTQQPASRNRLWIVIIFEHIVLAIKFFIAWVIPDTPANVDMAQRRERYRVAEIMSKAGVRRGPGKTITDANTAQKGREGTGNETSGLSANAEDLDTASSPPARERSHHDSYRDPDVARTPGASRRVPDPLPAIYVAKKLSHRLRSDKDSEV